MKEGQKIPFKCEKCEKSFEHRLGLEQHVHSKNHGFKCEKCDKILLSSFSLKQHMDAKHKKWICEFCGKEMETRKGWQLHLNAKHLTVECRKCKKRFASKSDLKAHVKDEHTPRCTVCKIELRERDRISHMRDVHFMCPCGIQCTSKEELYEHIDQTHNKVKVYTAEEEPLKTVKKYSLEPEYL